MIPFFSIIIPMYNCEKTIEYTLESVLKQSFKDYEIIIINDCSTDDSLNVLNKYINSTKFANNFNDVEAVNNFNEVEAVYKSDNSEPTNRLDNFEPVSRSNVIINENNHDNTKIINNSQKTKIENNSDKSRIIDYSNKLRIVCNEKNLGVAKTRNKGFELAKGKYIALLDSDDIWDSNKLEIQKKYIDETNCDICCTSYDFINDMGETIKKPYIIPSKISYKTLLKENVIGCSTVAIRRSLLNSNSMNKKYYHEDYALWLNLTRSGANVVGIEDVLMHYRIIENSRSYKKSSAAINRFKIYIEQEKLGVFKAIFYFLCYSVNGLRKRLL